MRNLALLLSNKVIFVLSIVDLFKFFLRVLLKCKLASEGFTLVSVYSKFAFEGLFTYTHSHIHIHIIY